MDVKVEYRSAPVERIKIPSILELVPGSGAPNYPDSPLSRNPEYVAVYWPIFGPWTNGEVNPETPRRGWTANECRKVAEAFTLAADAQDEINAKGKV